MKRNVLFLCLTLGCSLGFAACGDNNGEEFVPKEWSFTNLPDDSGSRPTAEQLSATVTQYVDHVVLPTYKDMLDKMTLYKQSVDAFLSSGSQNDLDNACDAWRNVRVPWEESEAFLYGVADLGQYDPSLDTWPLDRDGITQVITGGDFSDFNEDSEVAQNLRGFHTAEMLLFENGDPRNASELTANEKTYLRLVSERMLKDTEELYNGWKDGLGRDPIPSSYAEAMKAHDGSSDYAGLNSAAQAIELILNGNNGMAGIANEVGTAKIMDPVNLWNGGDQEGGVLAVESWYSWNSLTDFHDNIISIKNSYFGGRDLDAETASENSISSMIKMVNPTLDSLVIVQIEKTIEAIDNIPAPFRDHLDAATEINAASKACTDLRDGLELVSNKLAGN